MKNLRFILMFCLFGWGSSFAQNSAAVISASNCEKPDYPSASKRLEEEGTVRLKILVGVDGKVVESVVEKSSGFKRLDEAARLSLFKCQFKPATIEGRTQQSWATMTYTWSLGPSSPCNGVDVSKWDRCLGSLISPLGGMIVIEYVQGKQTGAGIEYDKSGNVIRSGIFNDGNLVEKRTLDPSKYPFKKHTTEASSTISNTNIQSCSGKDVSGWNNCFATTADLSGATYIGEWKAGRWDGNGTHTLLNGDKYVGEFRVGNYNGLGTYFFSDGEKYIGEFKNDLRNGKGTYFYLNGDKYIGEWKDDLRSGQGTHTYKNGEKYIGEFRYNYREGFGTLYSPTGVVVSQGLWTKSILANSSPDQQQTTKPSVNYATERRVALVLGNANYKVRPLKNPRNDADDVSRSLKATGFEVIDLRDATLSQMRTAVRQFGDRLINNDVGLVYYSGHGVEVKGRNYFIPVNADIQREDEIADQGLDVSLILEKMSSAGKGVNILIVDACRDDPFGRSFRSSSRGLGQMDAPRGTIIAYATSPGKVASDGDPRERNSPYTKHLVKAMQSPNKPIEQVFKEVRRAVQDETKNQQTPWENTSLSGDFFFKIN